MPIDPFATQTSDQQRQQAIGDMWHAEQRRRANDTIRVKNPASVIIQGELYTWDHKDFLVEWERLYHRVPYDNTLDTTRYIAEKYCREMFVEIMNHWIEDQGQKLLKRVGKEKPDVLLDKYLENQNVWLKLPRTDDSKIMAEVYPQLWVGLVKKFGLDDRVPDNTDKYAADLKKPEEKILEGLDNKFIIDTPITEDKETLAEEITQNVD